MKNDYQLLIGLWGAVVATVLGGIKMWELSRDRLRLSTSYYFTTSPEDGNKVIVHNTSKVPALVTYWELVWAGRWLGRTRFEQPEGWPQIDEPHFAIPAHSSHTLHFGEADHFSCRKEIEGHPVKLYLRLYLAGRRSATWLLVWEDGA